MSIFRTPLLISWHEVFKILVIGVVIWVLLAIHINLDLVKLIKARKVLNRAMNHVGITLNILETLRRKLSLRLISYDLLTLSWCCLSGSTRSWVAVRSALVDTLQWVEIVDLEVLLRLRSTVRLVCCLLHYQLRLLLGQLRTYLWRTSIGSVLFQQELLQIIII